LIKILLVKKLCSVVLAITLGASLSLKILPTASAVTVTPQSLASKINKSGLGCKKITDKTAMLFSGTKANCEAQGEKVSIEVYPEKYWKDALKMACAFGIGFIAVSNNKSWMVSAESRATAKKLVKPLGGKLTVFCNSKNIINEKKTEPNSPEPVSSSSPSPSPSPSASPAVAVAGSWAKPFDWSATIKESGFKYQLLGFQTGQTAAVCTKEAKYLEENPYEFGAEIDGDLCPQSESVYSESEAKTNEYAVLTLDYTNEGKEISYPGKYSLAFKIADSQGKIFEPVLVTYRNSKSLEINVVPGGKVTTTVYFKLPKTFKNEGSRIEVELFSLLTGKFYWSIL
jgi:hypothetical protein